MLGGGGVSGGEATTCKNGRMLADFNGTEWGSDYLTLKCDERVLLLACRPQDTGWAYGARCSDGTKGWFPASYWEAVEEEDAAAALAQQAPKRPPWPSWLEANGNSGASAAAAAAAGVAGVPAATAALTAARPAAGNCSVGAESMGGFAVADVPGAPAIANAAAIAASAARAVPGTGLSSAMKAESSRVPIAATAGRVVARANGMALNPGVETSRATTGSAAWAALGADSAEGSRAAATATPALVAAAAAALAPPVMAADSWGAALPGTAATAVGRASLGGDTAAGGSGGGPGPAPAPASGGGADMARFSEVAMRFMEAAAEKDRRQRLREREEQQTAEVGTGSAMPTVGVSGAPAGRPAWQRRCYSRALLLQVRVALGAEEQEEEQQQLQLQQQQQQQQHGGGAPSILLAPRLARARPRTEGEDAGEGGGNQALREGAIATLLELAGGSAKVGQLAAAVLALGITTGSHREVCQSICLEVSRQPEVFVPLPEGAVGVFELNKLTVTLR
mmetsp:Transcript_76267/g.210467  ORF Transcript_76267/g.210467 Transcript_76267/m.210467 type:complete len:509 (-) Transcript_76267:104-1630(-)